MEENPRVLSPFINGMDGVQKPCFDGGMVICLVVKIPIVKNVEEIRHAEVIDLFRQTCSQAPGLVNCYKAACGMIVGDGDGNQEHQPSDDNANISNLPTQHNLPVTLCFRQCNR